ncbi:hypothetical protein GCM10009798_33510 [Nocardioides panacihumi]|uniref:Tyr recombinase domain-containing protein n=1 Tax=Nocardioides panacihumi TaxID=400774 RepID=A0ABN2RK09_9ACTN
MTHRRSRDPIRHVDLDDLDVEIDAYIATHRSAAETAAGHRRRWDVWEKHCAESGVDPWDAPYSAFEDLLLSRREDGLTYSPSHMFNLLASITDAYSNHGLVPAHRREENKGAWSATFRGWQRDFADAAARGETVTCDHVPLMRSDVQQMLAVPLTAAARTRPCRVATLVACALLALDGGWELSRIRALRFDNVDLASETAIVIDGDRFICDHRERAPGVPWDCLVCAIRGLISSADRREGLIFDTEDRAEIGRWLRKQAGNWPFLRLGGGGRGASTMEIDPAADSWAIAGTRRGLVIVAHQPDSDSWLRGRAWVALAWQAGLRMVSDLVRLDREALAPVRNPSRGEFDGWRLTLGVAKNDPLGTRADVRVYTDATGRAAVDAISEYLSVRDAAQGRDGRLIVGGRRGLFAGGPMKKPLQAAKNDLDELSLLAGIEPVFTTYSIRKGFVAQAAADGWAFDRVQASLRHRKSDTTAQYFPKLGARQAAYKFQAELAEGVRRA